MIERILEFHNARKEKIENFLHSVKNCHENREKTFFELVFCIAVPQSKAPVTREAVRKMFELGVARNGAEQQILECLKAVRFNDSKAKRIAEARDNFDFIYAKISELKKNPEDLRKWLAENVKGIGWKEASHLLRNIGLGEHLAIFDIHVLRTMQEVGLISEGKEITSVTGKKYMEYEKSFQKLAAKHNLNPAQLDIAIWMMRSGNDEIM